MCLTYVASLWKRIGIYLLSFVDVIDSVLGVVMVFAVDVPLGAFEVSSSCLRPGLDKLPHTCIYRRHCWVRSVRPVKRR
jgi:hypothetical protein